MNKSIKSTVSENSDYRHKKFDHVRKSPTILENARSLAGTPTSSSYENFMKNEIDFDWQQKMDEINIPRTPIKIRRISKRISQNNTTSNIAKVPNAPKKRRLVEPITPVKTPLLPYSSPNLVPNISEDTLARICQYNKNMVRKFPKRERSAKDQERRDKNTIACRMSRRLKKIENLATEEQYKMFVQKHFEQQKRCIQSTIYLNELIKSGAEISNADIQDKYVQTIAKSLNLQYLESCLMNETKPLDLKVNDLRVKMENDEIMQNVETKSEMEDNLEYKAQLKRPFTIAFLLGSDQK